MRGSNQPPKQGRGERGGTQGASSKGDGGPGNPTNLTGPGHETGNKTPKDTARPSLLPLTCYGTARLGSARLFMLYAFCLSGLARLSNQPPSGCAAFKRPFSDGAHSKACCCWHRPSQMSRSADWLCDLPSSPSSSPFCFGGRAHWLYIGILDANPPLSLSPFLQQSVQNPLIFFFETNGRRVIHQTHTLSHSPFHLHTHSLSLFHSHTLSPHSQRTNY